mmetsp:Transcript_28281/g.44114  ORF Transcript_28281/g.44114 Transcript_28281/m.44114 type:complete len:152 (+) Transcript_28281:749-1204(+)
MLSNAPVQMALGPSLTDYTNFHGMLIRPRKAQACIQSFKGCILFMPSDYGRDSATFPLQDWSPFEVRSLNLWSYFALVFFSLTGLSTLLNFTKTLDARESDLEGRWSGEDPLESDLKELLDPLVLGYVGSHGRELAAQVINPQLEIAIARP